MRIAYLLAAPLLIAPQLAAQDAAESVPLTIASVHDFIDHVYSTPKPALREEATHQYLWMIGRIDYPLTDDERALITRHIRYLSLIMPKSERARMGVDMILADMPAPPGTGETLIRWWHRQDPLPATVHNERLEEHLARVDFALRTYTHADDVRGFDDRGEIGVRLGAPTRRREVRLLTPSLATHPHMSRLPHNEFWVYRGLGDAAHFLFVKASGAKPYKLASAPDLIPNQLLTGRRKTRLLITVMEEIFGQLALEHPHYGVAYDDVSAYVTLPPRGAQPPHIFARAVLDASRTDDARHARIRSREVPTFHSNVLGNSEPLNVGARVARFLEHNGRTRLEVYWGLAAESLELHRRHINRLRKSGHAPSDDYMLSAYIAHKDSEYSTVYVEGEEFLTPTKSKDPPAVRTISSSVEPGTAHFAMQFEQRWTQTDSTGTFHPGKLLRISTMAVDSVQAFRTDGANLEMSDIKPLYPGDTPYPFKEIDGNIPLKLYFEVYHLAFDSDLQTRYHIETNVVSLSRNEKRIGTGSSYESDTRMIHQTIELDLSEWDSQGPILVTVRATDEVSGSSVERSAEFFFER